MKPRPLSKVKCGAYSDIFACSFVSSVIVVRFDSNCHLNVRRSVLIVLMFDSRWNLKYFLWYEWICVSRFFVAVCDFDTSNFSSRISFVCVSCVKILLSKCSLWFREVILFDFTTFLCVFELKMKEIRRLTCFVSYLAVSWSLFGGNHVCET